jgi:alpha-glucuronidase
VRKLTYLVLSVLVVLTILSSPQLNAENGYRLWLRYDLISGTELLEEYQSAIAEIIFEGQTPVLLAAKEELQYGLNGLLGKEIPFTHELTSHGTILAGTAESSDIIASLNLGNKLSDAGEEGYIILSIKVADKACTVITANKDIGILYGVFHFLRLLQTHKDIFHLSIVSSPRIKYRLLNHWDNLDRTVERGYAGSSLWEWDQLPDHISPRYKDYARANASIGINGAALTNVNANALVLTKEYLEKVAVLADVFRPYGIKVYLTARFSAPIEIGHLETADPLDQQVIAWWNNKAEEIYSYIPDFGGFLVKANSEGQPGPQDYGRTHAEGANMLANAVAPLGGIVMWRAFVYSNNIPDDRAKQAYNEFKPLDGNFRNNVLIQVKNGPIDFQPREPFHPLFGAMPETPLMMEFQVTQEYLGQSTHLVYLAPLFKECLDSDTYARGKGSYVAKVIDGTLFNHETTGMAGVSNTGTDTNWCGHLFGQANWFTLGRLSWDHTLTSEEIADDWIRMTFTNDSTFIKPVKKMMLASREIAVNYMTPLGLHHIMARDHHYGPGPWVSGGRADWTSVYYHRADSTGIGFDRTSTGSNAVNLYSHPVQEKFESLNSCPEKLLLWFHHVSWDHKMNSGRTLWEELCYKYYSGVDSVRWMQKTWNSLEGKIDRERFLHVKEKLNMQEENAIKWRNACLLYFQTFSKRPIPERYEKPGKSLEYYMNFQYRPAAY